VADDATASLMWETRAPTPTTAACRGSLALAAAGVETPTQGRPGEGAVTQSVADSLNQPCVHALAPVIVVLLD
jgi:hypothetical protein